MDIVENEHEIDYQKFMPTEEQLKIAVKNFKLIYDPQNKMSDKDLFEFVDSGMLEYGRVTLQSFIQNTCDKSLEGVEKNEAEHTIMLICDYFNSKHHHLEHMLLSKRIYDTICVPIQLFENSAFMQCWGDILNQAIEYKQHQLECRANNFDPFSFPFDMEIIHELSPSQK